VEEEVVCVSVKGAGVRWVKFPRRCISRETSFESYVRPIELCQKPRAGASVELIRCKRVDDWGLIKRTVGVPVGIVLEDG